MPLGSWFLAVFFGFLYSVGRKFSLFCSLPLGFCVLFLQISTSVIVLKGIWNSRMLISVPGLLTIFA